MIDTIIVSGGDISITFALDFLKKIQKEAESQGCSVKLAAADRGYEFFLQTGIVPDLAIGDFDSLSEEGRKKLEEAEGMQVVYLKPEKDDSDTQSALKYMITGGSREIAILGATGSRMDHMMANMGLFLLGKELGAEIVIADPHNYMRLIQSGTELKKDGQFGKYVSFFPLGGDVRGLTLKGFCYPLHGYHLRTRDSGLTVSNEIREETASVTYVSGDLLMIMSRD